MARNQTYGVILMDANSADNDEEIQFLMTRRRNTYAFGDFVQGRYQAGTAEATLRNLGRMFNYMTLDEKKAIRTNNFVIVWYMYWNTTPSSSPSSFNDKLKFDNAKRLFTSLIAEDNGMSIAALIDRSQSISCIDMFEFPKGRRNGDESGRNAAERELIEETNFDKNFYAIFKDSPPYIHHFTGKDDGQRYSVNYYVGEIIVPRHHTNVSMQQWRQLMEVSEVRLFSLKVIRELFPSYVDACLYAIRQYRHILATSVTWGAIAPHAPL